MILFIVLLSASAFGADLCTDTDNGGSHRSDEALKTKGDVKYGITTQTDTCMTSPEGVSTNSSHWLKEYYCRLDKRESEVYDCVSLGFSGCENGACVGTPTATTTNTTNTTTTVTQTASCGDKIVEKAKGEECDPPNSICFGRSTAEYGSCQADCTCKISAAALKNMESQPAVCGDNYKHPDEDCEEDDDCSSGYVCSSCKCVKQLTQEEIEAMKKTAVKEEKEEVVEKKVYELPEVNLTGTNFTDEPAIKATSSIANFFKKIFGWIGALFS